MKGRKTHGLPVVALVAVALFSAGCGLDVVADYPNIDSKGVIIYDSELKNRKDDSIFGEGGFDLFNLGGNKKTGGGSGVGIGVNSYLWRATLDTISFMPLSSADPFGGVIITDWYAPPESPNERFKVTAYILDRSLRADGVRVSVFRQVQESPGNWIDAPVDPSMGVDLENTILTRARQLKIRTAPG